MYIYIYIYTCIQYIISADPSPPSSRGRRLGRTKQMALALTFCLVAHNSHVSAATIRHRAFSGVEGLSTPAGLPSANTSPLSRFLAGSKVPKRHRLCRPNGHPLGLNSAGAVLFRMGCPAPIPPHSPGF